MYYATGMNKRSRPEDYRNEWNDEDLRLPAQMEEEQAMRIRPVVVGEPMEGSRA